MVHMSHLPQNTLRCVKEFKKKIHKSQLHQQHAVLDVLALCHWPLCSLSCHTAPLMSTRMTRGISVQSLASLVSCQGPCLISQPKSQ